MKYSCEYILRVAGKYKKIPPIPPKTVCQLLTDVLDAGLSLTKPEYSQPPQVVCENGDPTDWVDLPPEMAEMMLIPFLLVQVGSGSVRKTICFDQDSRCRLLDFGFPDPVVMESRGQGGGLWGQCRR